MQIVDAVGTGHQDPFRNQVEQALKAASSNKQLVLPAGWDLHTDKDGREFFVNLQVGLTQWEMPQLPPQWEEHMARDGKVYYLRLSDGKTQWEWPAESFEARLMMALPGSTAMSSLPQQERAWSEGSNDTAVGAADQLDAEALLAMPPPKKVFVQVESAGYQHGSYARFYVDGHLLKETQDRGLNVFALDTWDGRVIMDRCYDFVEDPGIGLDMGAELSDLPRGALVMVALAETGMEHVDDTALQALFALGAVCANDRGTGEAYALIGRARNEPGVLAYSESRRGDGHGMAKADVELRLGISLPGSPRSPRESGNVLALAEKKQAGPASQAVATEWGLSKVDKEWEEVKSKLDARKEAHDKQFATAKKVPGVREFVRNWEMNDIVANWDRQLDNATQQADLYARSVRQLGYRAELRKEELRIMFPVIQRLQWTKWDDLEIFVHCLMHAMPTQASYLNTHLPTKYNRCILHIFGLAVMFLASTLMVTVEAPVPEDIEALDRSAWTLLGELFSMPFQMECLGVMLLAGPCSWAVRSIMRLVFYSYRLSTEHEPPSDLEERRAQMKFWHSVAEMGKWVCLVGIIVCVSVALTLCSNAPQPRAVGVVRVYLMLLSWTVFFWPLTKAITRTMVLSTARKSRACDGLLNVYPGAMDFAHVGVRTPEFLSWRIQKSVQEEELLRLVYEAADGECGTIPEMVRQKLEDEAANFTDHMEHQLMYPTGQPGLTPNIGPGNGLDPIMDAY